MLFRSHTESIFLLSNEEPFETTRNFPATIIVSLILGNSLLVKRGPSIKVWEIETIAKQSNLAFLGNQENYNFTHEIHFPIFCERRICGKFIKIKEVELQSR